MINRIDVTLIVRGEDLGLPFFTKPMLDLWVHALDGPNPFIIARRTGDRFRFIQTYRDAPASYTLQYRDGADVEVMSTEGLPPATVVDLIWDWAAADDRTGFAHVAWEAAR